ncbi:MAG: adenylate/guanylate cyclase domain-containing protein [Myxococcales bacterium]|nr:adenylate/guanylate cyclase domain-containing protein [Myxococcales bacterium]
MTHISHIFDWLVDGAPGAPTPVHVVQRMGSELHEAGIPVHRIEAFVRTLHPHIVGRSFAWLLGGKVEVRENSYGYLHSAEFLGSPLATVFRDGQPIRRRLDRPGATSDYPLLAELAEAGYTDYFAAPLTFLSGQVHAITFATRAPAGFDDAHIAAIVTIVRPLSRVAEIFALTRTAANLLNTYVGHDAGERILQGRIQRGDTDSLRAVLWFSDLRGFTAMSATLEPRDIIRVLNDLFDCQVPAIERRGGQVLKFIGDGLLAIFPLDATGPAGPQCDAALDAAVEAFAALDVFNMTRTAAGMAPIRFGLALHVGEVAYGNIGGSNRLDFTCIGPAVNLAARLEGLTSGLGKHLVASAEFAKQTSRLSTMVGAFELKGVAQPVEVFEFDA